MSYGVHYIGANPTFALDTAQDHKLFIEGAEDLTADRSLRFGTGDTDRTWSMPGMDLLGATDGQVPVFNVATSAFEPQTLALGSTTFLGLTDTPGSYVGEGSKLVAVNVAENALEFISASSGTTTFLDLTDTPASYSGQAGQFVRVKGTEDGLEFAAGGGGGVDEFLELIDTPGTYTAFDKYIPEVDETGGQLVFTENLSLATLTLSGDLTVNGTAHFVGAIDAQSIANFQNDLLLTGDTKIQFRDPQIFIHSPNDGELLITCDNLITVSASSCVVPNVVFEDGAGHTITLQWDPATDVVSDSTLTLTRSAGAGFFNAEIEINSSTPTITLDDWFDQDVRTTALPQFVSARLQVATDLDTNAPGFDCNRARDGFAAVQSGDILMFQRIQGQATGGFLPAASIRVEAAGNFSSGNSPGRIVWGTTPSASSTVVDRMQIQSDGTVEMLAYGQGVATFDSSGVLSSLFGSNGEVLQISGGSLVFDTVPGGVTDFLSLTDTPSSYAGESLKVVRVNAGETALEFATGGGGASNWVDLGDTPGSITADQFVIGNSGGTALEFFDLFNTANTWTAAQTIEDNVKLIFGSAPDAFVRWKDNITREQLQIGIPTNNSSADGVVAILEAGFEEDPQRLPVVARNDPTLRIWGEAGDNANHYIEFYYSVANTRAYINWGFGELVLAGLNGPGVLRINSAEEVFDNAGLGDLSDVVDSLGSGEGDLLYRNGSAQWDALDYPGAPHPKILTATGGGTLEWLVPDGAGAMMSFDIEDAVPNTFAITDDELIQFRAGGSNITSLVTDEGGGVKRVTYGFIDLPTFHGVTVSQSGTVFQAEEQSSGVGLSITVAGGDTTDAAAGGDLDLQVGQGGSGTGNLTFGLTTGATSLTWSFVSPFVLAEAAADTTIQIEAGADSSAPLSSGAQLTLREPGLLDGEAELKGASNTDTGNNGGSVALTGGAGDVNGGTIALQAGNSVGGGGSGAEISIQGAQDTVDGYILLDPNDADIRFDLTSGTWRVFGSSNAGVFTWTDGTSLLEFDSDFKVEGTLYAPDIQGNGSGITVTDLGGIAINTPITGSADINLTGAGASSVGGDLQVKGGDLTVGDGSTNPTFTFDAASNDATFTYVNASARLEFDQDLRLTGANTLELGNGTTYIQDVIGAGLCTIESSTMVVRGTASLTLDGSGACTVGGSTSSDAVTLRFGNSASMTIKNPTTVQWQWTSSGDFEPGADDARNFGSATKRISEGHFVDMYGQRVRSDRTLASSGGGATTDDIVILDGSSANVTYTLIAASGNTGREVIVKCIDATNTVQLDGNGTETIDGSSSPIGMSQWDSYHLYCDGSGWLILAKYP